MTMFVFIETNLFTRLAEKRLSDDALAQLQRYLNENPEAGDIIRGFGWSAKAPLGSSRTREARWFSNHLLPEVQARRDLVVDSLCEERRREHLDPASREDQGGD